MMVMKLTYETGIATFIQFITLGLLNIISGLTSVVTDCREGATDCVTGALVSVVFFLLICGWFGFVALLGYLAQERRSKRMAQLLIAAEAMVVVIAGFNAKHHNDLLGLIISLVDLVLATWIIILAFRLMRSGGKRITRTRQRTRSRRAR
jgi:hypothetical protein